ncbi:MAG: tRNA (adenine22-N1)-methyltransferase [Clostridiales bacterium]|nr:tRNA (adenine22-N1)-methyltransferase [Clostridiales bacterium]
MVQLSKRLRMIANMVTRGSCVADIGCDHAHTSIFLIENQIAQKVIAMDVNKGPLERATENVARYHVSDRIVIRRSNGLEALQEGEVDTLLISGMGGALIIRILEDGKPVVENIRELILQPQSEIELVRKYLHTIGFSILEENMLKEDGKFYVAIHALRGKEQYEKELFYSYGKSLLIQKNKALQEYLNHQLQKTNQILNALKASQNTETKERMDELGEEIIAIEEALTYYR